MATQEPIFAMPSTLFVVDMDASEALPGAFFDAAAAPPPPTPGNARETRIAVGPIGTGM